MAHKPMETCKIVLPPDRYADKHSAGDTDFNGIINVIINCTEFEAEFADDLRQTTNICVKARDVLRNIRHASETDMPDCEMFNVIQTLKILLSDKKCLIGLNECQAVLIKLDQAFSGHMLRACSRFLEQ
ncbi:hypothetical protein DPMN_184235 [Dreissena polymorpha]|uniref:Uncharacterized protein n=1 Tax=Dreissena polymorpha TaxID=45954 RepID=A0A9D4I670_DREPO|nr:hypothetical protein DPMN_184235 [Dreissena polymorpha]